MSPYYFLLFTSTCSLFLYLYLTVIFFKQYFELRRFSRLSFSLSLIISSAVIFIARAHLADDYQTFIMILMIMYCTMRCMFKITKTVAYYGAIRYTFYMFTIRTLVFSIYSIVMRESMMDIWIDPLIYISLFQASLIITVFFLYIKTKKVVTRERMLRLFSHEDQLIFILLLKTILGLFLMVFAFGARFESNFYWFSTLQLLTAIMVILIAIISFLNALRITALIDYETRTKILESQMSIQLNHYKAYQRYTNTFREFRHDYNKTLSVVNSLLRSDQYEEAIQVLDKMGMQMEQSVQAHKEYSNNIFLDALLQDFANRANANNIKFDARVYWFEQIRLDELDFVRLFSNLLTNAYEASLELEEDKRWIKLESNPRKHWLNIQISNAFTGRFNPDLESTKNSSKKTRGLGIGISRGIVEDMGGVFTWDTKDDVFIVNINFPINQNRM